MKYLSIGTNYVSSDLFLKIKNTKKLKPSGGIWATEYNPEYKDYNEWVDYLCQNPYILFYHNFKSLDSIPGVYITLKDTSNIFIIDSVDKVNYLKEKYPFNNWIDYEKMALDYDGIYVNVQSLNKNDDPSTKLMAAMYSVNTLLLFNTSCISYYQKASLDLSGTNLNNPNMFPEYIISIDEKKYQVENPSLEVQRIMEIIKQYITRNNIKITKENYEFVKNIFKGAIKEVLRFQNAPEKETLLIRKVFNQF